MRPVNLIPPEERRGDGAPSRTGSLSYVVIGALALVLGGVLAVSLLNKQVADRTTQVTELEAESAALQSQVQSLADFTSFQQVHDARVATVQQLAASRFDWERVLSELALVMPRYVWLTNLSGSVSPDVAAGEGENPLRAGIAGPALILSGCGRSQRDVARLIAAMEDIDGVTRVTATDSEKSDSVAAPTPVASGGGKTQPVTGDDCQTRPTITKFNLIAAFDGVAVAPSTATPPPDTTPTAPATDDPQQESRAAVNEAGERTEDATNLVPGG